MTSSEFPRLVVRRQVSEDKPAVKDLQMHFLSEVSNLRGGEELVRTVGAASEAEESTVLVVGEIDGCIVGYCSVVFGPNDTGTVDQIYVEPGARRIGVGEALLEAVVKLAFSRGLKSLDALALPGAREVKNLLEGLGFKARLLVLKLSLAGFDSRSG